MGRLTIGVFHDADQSGQALVATRNFENLSILFQLSSYVDFMELHPTSCARSGYLSYVLV